MKYLAIARTRLMASLIYDRDVLVRSIFMFVALVVFVQLWTTTYASTGQTIIQGFSLRDIVWYLVITEIVALGTPSLPQTIDTEVRSGDVAYSLSKPYSYPLYHLASYWGETLVKLPLNAIVGSAVAFVAVGPPPTTVASLAGAILLLIGAVTLKGIMELLIGLSAFWVEDTLPAQWIYSKFIITIGGLLLPLDLFPDWLANIARNLPFASIAYAPARAFVGADLTTFATLLISQCTWLVLAWLAVTLVFAQATRRMVAHGG
jgi:ABC-2 type transport system permease protein